MQVGPGRAKREDMEELDMRQQALPKPLEQKRAHELTGGSAVADKSMETMQVEGRSPTSFRPVLGCVVLATAPPCAEKDSPGSCMPKYPMSSQKAQLEAGLGARPQEPRSNALPAVVR